MGSASGAFSLAATGAPGPRPCVWGAAGTTRSQPRAPSHARAGPRGPAPRRLRHGDGHCLRQRGEARGGARPWGKRGGGGRGGGRRGFVCARRAGRRADTPPPLPPPLPQYLTPTPISRHPAGHPRELLTLPRCKLAAGPAAGNGLCVRLSPACDLGCAPTMLALHQRPRTSLHAPPHP
jgi:hypothetical protein